MSNAGQNASPGDSSAQDRQIAVATLTIAVVAFVTAISQLLSMIITSARGLPSCDKTVMGKWATPWWRSSKFRFLRLQVKFTAPVIFLASPENEDGPEPGKPIYYLDGNNWDAIKIEEPKVTKAANPRSPLVARWRRWLNTKPQRGPGDAPPSDPEQPTETQSKKRVHTVNNELASWVVLLEELQAMEKASREWDSARRDKQQQACPVVYTPKSVTLSVGIQSKTRSFDHNPAVKKPYATSTICHLIEIAALLGIHWKRLDRNLDQYRAEGNGYSLLGWRKHDFGLVFTFERFGLPEFERTRIIPVHAVKELCFGNMPTLFRYHSTDDKWAKPYDDFETPPNVLRLGSRREMSETFSRIGCPTNVVDLILWPEVEHEHLFSGMCVPLTPEFLLLTREKSSCIRTGRNDRAQVPHTRL